MKHYVVYDKATGHIVHTHKQVNVAGKFEPVEEDEIFALLGPHIDKQSVAVAIVNLPPESGRSGGHKIDLHTHALATTP